ncbi:hypothetical protein CHU98_g11403 [Xylaria longipes]|nr:hypothetical protein CHU98_g11403 [Xylaria longipes]
MATQLDDESRRLLQLGGLIQMSIANYVNSKHSLAEKNESSLPAKPLFDEQRTLLAAAGLLTELVSEPQNRLLEVSSQYFEARALHIVADKRIPDILAKSGDKGVDIKTLASTVGIEYRKLSRLMRCLCSIHLFDEKEEDVFTNNRISLSLVDNEPLRAYIMLFGLDLYSSSDYLPRYLNDPNKGPSYAVNITAWQDALNTQKTRWDWLEEEVRVDALQAGNNSSRGGLSAYPGVFGAELQQACGDLKATTLIKRPEHTIFGLAMVGGGRVFGQAHLYDFPWESLGPATIVDVGGGVGGFCLQLSHLYPDLKFVLQDRAPVLKQAQSEPSMGPRSRIMICDQVMNTTAGCSELAPAPYPLPANWGYYTRYSHQRDLAMMSIINGIERKPAEFRNLIDRAGLKLRKIWDCRSQVGLLEIVLPDSELV